MMSHKAYLFDYEGFASDLRPSLEFALITGDCAPLIGFIRTNLDRLTDPYDGKPPSAPWETLVGMRDPQGLGDFALTRYYNPAEDVGLGYSWADVDDLLALTHWPGPSPILGDPIGEPGKTFDPGKLGSYFQSPAQVAESLQSMRALSLASPSTATAAAVEMLETALKSDKGLYITF